MLNSFVNSNMLMTLQRAEYVLKYRVCLKSFPDYRHLLQEYYVE